MIQVGSLPNAPLQARPETRVFRSPTIGAVRLLVSRRATEAGMDARRRHDLVLAVCEVATNSVRHAQGMGVLRVWRDGHALVCEVADRGRFDRPLADPELPGPGQEGGYGLWIADQLCDLVQVRSTETGSVIRLHMGLGSG